MNNLTFKALFAFVACFIFTAFSTIAAQDSSDDKEKAALDVALTWLAMVDEGKYLESWRDSSEFFKNVIKKEHWEKSMLTIRKPLGKLLSRQLKSKNYRTSLPGAPDGEYVVIQFDSSFENKKKAVETITPMMDKDGKWRVSGYYIK